MKPRLDPRLKLNRVRNPDFEEPHGNNGAFCLRGPLDRHLLIISSDQFGWDHVSVSVDGSTDTPTWEEMAWVKDLFFEPHETVIQYHPAAERYINIHQGCLHLWRPQNEQLPVPPLAMV